MEVVLYIVLLIATVLGIEWILTSDMSGMEAAWAATGGALHPMVILAVAIGSIVWIYRETRGKDGLWEAGAAAQGIQPDDDADPIIILTYTAAAVAGTLAFSFWITPGDGPALAAKAAISGYAAAFGIAALGTRTRQFAARRIGGCWQRARAGFSGRGNGA